MRTGGKILVIRGGAIGDFLLTLPVLSALRANFPHTHIEVLGYPKVAQLAVMGGLANEVRSIEAGALAGFFARDGNLSDALAEYFSTFNIILSYLYDPDEIFRANVRRCSSAQFIQGPHRPAENENIHATEIFLKPLERLAIFDADSAPRLVFDSPQRIPNQLAFHPGSGSETKNWPERNWLELLERISNETSLNLLMVGGEAEGQRLERLQKVFPQQRLQIARNLPLSDLAKQLAASAFFVGHDSGITHLAGAIGVKVLVLWGPSNEQIWRPRSEKMKLLQHPNGLHALSASDVFEAICAELYRT